MSSSASNIEQFLIEFVFQDEKAVKKIKEFSQSIDAVINKTREKRKIEKQGATESAAGVKKQKDGVDALTKAQHSLMTAMKRAKQLGMETDSYEKSLRAAKKTETLYKRRLELISAIKREELNIASQKHKAKTSPSTPKGDIDLEGNKLKEAQRRLALQLERGTKRGMDVSGEENVLASTTKLVALEKARVDLAHRIQMEKLKESKTTDQIMSKEAMSQKVKEERLERARQSAMVRLRASAGFQKLDGPSANAIQKDARAMFAAARSAQDLADAKARLASRMRELGRVTDNTKRKMLGLHNVQRGLTNSTRNMIHSYASVFALMAMTGNINRVGQGFEAINSQMLAATGSSSAAAQELQYLDDLTGRLGMSLLDTADAYAKLRFTAGDTMSSNQVQSLFKGLTEFGTVMGVDRERMKWSMMAVTQIL